MRDSEVDGGGQPERIHVFRLRSDGVITLIVERETKVFAKGHVGAELVGKSIPTLGAAVVEGLRLALG